MDVTVVGGGPGGLYASLLLQKTHPDWAITVHERNPPDVTYGWGIVFPNRALSNLADADEPSHRAITDAFTRWEPFDIHYRGERYRCGGHTFASMMRTDLLSVLQKRCADLGVDLRFESAVDDPATLAETADLLVAADGIHSETRSDYADAFGTETVAGDARFSWFGTDQPFEALSHIFVENEDGIWCAHTYPGRTSTFIVDCDATTWANASLDDLDEPEYLTYLEDVFTDSLDGHALRSQQDRWRTFTTVTNETWYHDNVVLVGDAAHTAHYSIGSGTTLALEDGIGLMRAFEGFDGDLEAALADYERRRQAFVEPLQAAAERSRRHFEHIRRFFGTAGPQFAVHHLTRSGRLTYGSLAQRDPSFVTEFDHWFVANATPLQPDAGNDNHAPPRRQPLALRDLTLPNRLVGVVEPTRSSVDGRPSPFATAAFVERAAAGFGLVLTDPLAVSPSGRLSAGGFGLYDPAHRDAWRDAVRAANERGDARFGAHLVHAGPRAARDPRVFAGGDPMPHERAWSPPPSREFPERPESFEPATLTQDRMDRVRAAFVEATRHANAAGFDYLQLHAGHGYLLSAFLSPATNDREDQYGGSLAARMRFPMEIIEVVRVTWPDDKPLGVTLQTADWIPGGLTLPDAFDIARALDEHGVDLVVPVAGGVGASERPGRSEGVSGYSDHLAHEVGVRTMATPHTTDPDKVDTLVGTGRAALCTFDGRPGE